MPRNSALPVLGGGPIQTKIFLKSQKSTIPTTRTVDIFIVCAITHLKIFLTRMNTMQPVSQKVDGGYQLVIPTNGFGGYKTLVFNVIMAVLAVTSYFNPEFNPPTQQTIGLLLDQVLTVVAVVGNFILRFYTTRPALNRSVKDKTVAPTPDVPAMQPEYEATSSFVAAPKLKGTPKPAMQPDPDDISEVTFGGDDEPEPSTAIVPVEVFTPEKDHFSVRDEIGTEALEHVTRVDLVISQVDKLYTAIEPGAVDVIGEINTALPVSLDGDKYETFTEYKNALRGIINKFDEEMHLGIISKLDALLQKHDDNYYEIKSTTLG